MPGHRYTTDEQIGAFWEKVDHSGGEDACWIWKGTRNDQGYGLMRWRGRETRAHRISYELAHGEFDYRLEVCHDCPTGDNPSCVNPKHLFLGTHRENVADMMRKRRNRPCNGSANGMAKLTESIVVDIRQRFERDPVNQQHLAREFGVSSSAISYVVNGKTWQHVAPAAKPLMAKKQRRKTYASFIVGALEDTAQFTMLGSSIRRASPAQQALMLQGIEFYKQGLIFAGRLLPPDPLKVTFAPPTSSQE